MKNAFHEWLRSPEGGQFWERCFGRKNDDFDEKSAFWEYVMTRAGRGAATLHLLVVREDWEGLRCKLYHMRQLYRAEQKRDLLYQRVRKVLHDADCTYGYQPGDKFSWYGATDPTAPQAGTYEELRAVGFAPICPALDSDAVRTGDGILELAASFREQLATHRGQDCRISLQALCAFIRDNFDHVYAQNKPRTVKTRTDAGDDKLGSVMDEKVQNLSNIADRVISSDTLHSAANDWRSEATLARLADVVAYQLEREKLLLLVCLITYCNLTMAQTAKALGYAGPSGVAAPFKKAQIVIKEATSLMDGMGEEDLNGDMFHHFLGLLLAACKDGDCSRYGR